MMSLVFRRSMALPLLAAFATVVIQTGPPGVAALNCTIPANSTVVLTKEEQFFAEVPQFFFDYETQTSAPVVLTYTFGILYIFLALAIVCDEFFVPALEVIAQKWAIEDEVAGATLMAAGGSAPELFTSFFGTFQESAVGFGTIVGSAIFNVLFVIGTCALFSKETLTVTGWPLFRDSFYYAASLACLAIFFGYWNLNRTYCVEGEEKDQKEVSWLEALALLVLYLGYILIMILNSKIKQCISCCSCGENRKSTVAVGDASSVDEVEEIEAKEIQDLKSMVGRRNIPRTVTGALHLKRRGKFRAGILQIMGGQSLQLHASYAAIAIHGDVKETFDYISHLKNSSEQRIDAEKIKILLDKIYPDSDINFDEVTKIMDDIDLDHDGSVDIHEFEKWYVSSELIVKKQMEEAFVEFDGNKNGVIERDELERFLKRTLPQPTPEEIEYVVKDLGFEDSNDALDQDTFANWYTKTNVGRYFMRLRQSQNQEYVDAAPPLKLQWPKGCFKQVFFLLTLPIVIPLVLVIPDVRKRGFDKCYAVSFLLSIAFIGVLTFWMVRWTIIIGKVIGIPDEVMGLTLLAAGTSIPDLLSSVIVARKGLGDMAVSSSLGSNIFDVLVGLPLPWACKAAFNYFEGKEPFVIVIADTLTISILILFGVIISVIVTVFLSGWKLTKCLGVIMFVLYFAFVLQDLARNPNVVNWSMVRNGDMDGFFNGGE